MEVTKEAVVFVVESEDISQPAYIEKDVENTDEENLLLANIHADKESENVTLDSSSEHDTQTRDNQSTLDKPLNMDIDTSSSTGEQSLLIDKTHAGNISEAQDVINFGNDQSNEYINNMTDDLIDADNVVFYTEESENSIKKKKSKNNVNMDASNKTAVESKRKLNENEVCKVTGNVIIDSVITITNYQNNTCAEPSRSEMPFTKKKKVELFTKVEGPSFYNVTGNIATDPVISKNLPQVFESLPIFGKPNSKADLQEFLDAKLRAYIGQDIADEEYEELAKYCSPDHLRTGKELTMSTSHPMQWVMSSNWKEKLMKEAPVDLSKLNLLTVRKSLTDYQRDSFYLSAKRLKYRSMRMFSLHQESDEPITGDPDLEPGKDMLFHIRIYRPFFNNGAPDPTKRRHYRCSLFLCNLIMHGRNKLSELRDRIVCSNDLEMRVDASNSPDNLPVPTAKEVFPSGFLFINNVFYVDTRDGCSDNSAPIREWAQRKGIGTFPHRDMCDTTLDEIVLRLGYPEVYVHQGNCEHVFTFSEIRLLLPSDPLYSCQYPCHTQISMNQLFNCTTCAEFSAKWLVTNCERVPFDPAMFCDTCFRQYLYKGGVKIGDFKAYRYRGNEVNVLKPHN